MGMGAEGCGAAVGALLGVPGADPPPALAASDAPSPASCKYHAAVIAVSFWNLWRALSASSS